MPVATIEGNVLSWINSAVEAGEMSTLCSSYKADVVLGCNVE